MRTRYSSPATPEAPRPAPARRRRSQALSGSPARLPEAGPLPTRETEVRGQGVALMTFVGEPAKGSKGRRSPHRAYEKALAEIEGWRNAQRANADANPWADATPAHFVALYAWLHEEVYGAAPAELRSEAWWGAVSAAGKMLRDEFGNEPARMLGFMRWTWQRERGREKGRGEDAEDSRRIGWRLQFVLRHLVTDYRVATARAGRKVNR